MPNKSCDTRSRAGLLANAYVEALVGLFALRLEDVKSTVRIRAPEMTVMSSYDGEHINLNARRVVDELSTSGAELVTSIEQTTAAFVAAMWGLLRSHTNYDQIATEPEVQFVRHLRNACSHDGRWNFKELKTPARWRDKTLGLPDSGQPVFNGVLKHGDVMLLFVDIDQQYFQL